MTKFYTFCKEIKPYVDSDTITNREYYALEINNNRILLSFPRVQCTNEFKFEDMNDAMYFYYDVEIQELTNDGWVKIANSGVYDFPAILAFSMLIDEMKTLDLKNDVGRREFLYDTFENGRSRTDFETQKTTSVSGMFVEDEYTITKVYRYINENYNCEKDIYEDEEFTWYNVYFGISTGSPGNTIGFKVNNLTNKDLETVKKWVDEFLKYTIRDTQAEIDNYIDELETNEENTESEYCDDILTVYKYIRKETEKKDCKEILASLYDEHSLTFKKMAELIRQGENVNYKDFIRKDFNNER